MFSYTNIAWTLEYTWNKFYTYYEDPYIYSLSNSINAVEYDVDKGNQEASIYFDGTDLVTTYSLGDELRLESDVIDYIIEEPWYEAPSTQTGGIDEYSWEWDANGDGETSWGEFFSGIANSIKSFFVSLWNLFDNAQKVWDEVDKATTTEQKLINFIIPQTHAEFSTWSSLSNAINNKVDEEQYQSTVLWKFDTFFKWFAIFFITVISIAIIIYFNNIHKND